MKKKLISLLAVASMISSMAVSASADGVTPKIIVDEKELFFGDQKPVIVEETNRTLIPLRFVLEAAGANVKWDGENRTVTVDAADNRNRVVLTIDSDEMQMYYYPSVKESVHETVKLDQKPVIMNNRTMIPVRAVLEGIGAQVDWDQETHTIDVKSRAYIRYMRNMDVEGYEVNYPLAEGEVSFDKKKERETDEPYNPENDLPAVWLTVDKEAAAVDETVDVYVNIKNLDKLSADAILQTMTLTLDYDSEKLHFSSYKYIDENGEEYDEVIGASNAAFENEFLKIASIANLAMEEDIEPTKDGAIAKITFNVASEDEASVKISKAYNSKYGHDTSFGFKVDGKTVSIDDYNEVYINTTPVVINAK